jgi:outer membrane protein OmpA-like peptidoglycan-associated protein
MTGLMMIFMLVAIIFMIQVKREEKTIVKQEKAIESLTLEYSDLRTQLYQDLTAKFKDDLSRWNAELSPVNLSLRFKEPSIQFDSGSCVIKPGFAEILRSFFPRYIDVLYSPKYRAAIEEVRIEGYTSSKWEKLLPEPAFYKNMELSQCRTRAVLEYVFGLPEVRDRDRLYWLVRKITANGLSSSKPIVIVGTNDEDQIASQRVEFRVRTDPDDRLERILKALPR